MRFTGGKGDLWKYCRRIYISELPQQWSVIAAIDPTALRKYRLSCAVLRAPLNRKLSVVFDEGAGVVG
jgi:hypothetical protein